MEEWRGRENMRITAISNNIIQDIDLFILGGLSHFLLATQF